MSVRTSSLVAGLLIVVGGAAAANGATVLALTGTDSAVSPGAVSVASPGIAVMTADGDLDARGTDGLGIRLSLSVRADEPVFIGVGPAEDVDRYLAGAATDTVEDVELRPLRVDTEHRSGSALPAPPGRQSFWLTQSGGTATGTVTWPVQDGRHRVVVMNADGSPGVRADVTTTVRVEHLTGVAAGLLGGGLTSALAGALVLLRARRRPPQGLDGPPPAAPAPDGSVDVLPAGAERRSDELHPAR